MFCSGLCRLQARSVECRVIQTSAGTREVLKPETEKSLTLHPRLETPLEKTLPSSTRLTSGSKVGVEVFTFFFWGGVRAFRVFRV